MEHARETFMEEKKSFAEASTSGSQDKPTKEMDPSMLTNFLETCMKLLRDSKVVKGLQELINRCSGKENTPGELCVVRKIGKNKVFPSAPMFAQEKCSRPTLDPEKLDPSHILLSAQ